MLTLTARTAGVSLDAQATDPPAFELKINSQGHPVKMGVHSGVFSLDTA